MERLAAIVARLREHCPWTAALSHASLAEYLIEESYELVEVIEDAHPQGRQPGTAAADGDWARALRGELGDLLLQVVLHAQLAQEGGRFGLEDVANGLSAKLVRRSPHVFEPDGSLRSSFPGTLEQIEAGWEAAKRAENPQRSGPFDGIPRHLPALALAAETVRRLPAGVRLPGPTSMPSGAGQDQTGAEQAQASGQEDPAAEAEARLGARLLAVVAEAQAEGLDAERALRGAVRRLQSARIRG